MALSVMTVNDLFIYLLYQDYYKYKYIHSLITYLAFLLSKNAVLPPKQKCCLIQLYSNKLRVYTSEFGLLLTLKTGEGRSVQNKKY